MNDLWYHSGYTIYLKGNHVLRNITMQFTVFCWLWYILYPFVNLQYNAKRTESFIQFISLYEMYRSGYHSYPKNIFIFDPRKNRQKLFVMLVTNIILEKNKMCASNT